MARPLLEFQVVGVPDSPPLKVDREAGVIYGVRVLGRYSKNRYVPEAVNGTEYSEACMDDAVRRGLYEGVHVNSDHPADRTRPGVERATDDGLGVLRNVRKERCPKTGDPALVGDFHFLRSKDLNESVCEDVERRLGVFGLSHNASAERERFDPRAKRLVIESLAAVRGVDLVRRPATNTNLWESERPMPITIRSLLESRRAALSKPRRKWADRLVEMYEEDPSMGAEAEPAAETSPDDALKAGFEAAMLAIIRGDGTAQEKAKKIGEYLKTHEKLTQPAEPAAPTESDDEDGDEGKDVKEQVGDGSSKNQAGQRRAMHAKDPDDHVTHTKAESLQAENDALRLCLLEGVKPTPAQLKALTLLESEAERKELVAGFPKAATTTTTTTAKPKSGIPVPKPADPAKDRVESAAVEPAAALAALYG